MRTYYATIIMYIIIIIYIVGTIFLQFFLSKKESKWLGLFLPIIAFIFSILNVLNIRETDIITRIITIVSLLIISNIHTLILLSIFTISKNKMKKKHQLEKMNIQDL